jgi:hypothetical protein
MRSKYRYWGYRFLALVIHYAEDVCQPYHSEALPQADYSLRVELLHAASLAYSPPSNYSNPI